MYETRFQNEFERERAIFETDLLQHPNILGISHFELIFFSFENIFNFLSAFFGADFFAKTTETCHILIFEWHEDGTLYDVLKKNKNKPILTIDKLLQYSISLCDGLAHLHAIKYGTNGKNFESFFGLTFEFLDIYKPQMAHCDIKSSNILVKSDGDCCLSDFSLAVRCDT
jgi:serine/threonine protein kinase